MKIYFVGFLLSFTHFFAQTNLLGSLVSEEGFFITNVQVVNISNGQKTLSNSQGKFSISAKAGDELRFVKENYERGSKRISSADFSTDFSVVLLKTPMKIEEVEILKLTGDLSKDSKRLSKVNKLAEVKKNIGLPEGPEKPREKPAEVANDILMPLLFAQVNVQAIYDVVSGKSRRLKSLYKYEDLQENINWLKERIDSKYFTDQGLNKDKINEFLEFSLLVSPNIKRKIYFKNLMQIKMELDKMMELYKKQSK